MNGNGSGLTNSIFGKSTDAPCKFVVVVVFVTVDSSLFIIGNVGNGPGSTNLSFGKLTAAPCK
jgi:hypothetical protein